MKVTIVFTGKTREKYLREGVDEYLNRLRRYIPLSVMTLPDVKVKPGFTEKQVKALEGKQLMQRLKPADHVVLLDERGTVFSSEEFAGYLSKLEGRTGQTTFVAGGAYGFSEEVYRRADAMIALSAMTFSHQMVRLIFTEQLYRGYTILKGEPYHHK